MDTHGLKATPWEKAAEVGEGTLRKFLDGETDTMQERTYAKLASKAATIIGKPVQVSDLLHPAVQPQLIHNDVISDLSTEPHAKLEERQRVVNAPPREPPNRTLPGIPVMGTSLAGSEGDFQMNGGEPIDRVPRPSHLKDRQGLFCVFVEGESMRPWKRPGQIVYIDPTRRPQINDHVVVELKSTPPDEDRPAFLKLLVGRSPTKIKLMQYRPEKVFEVDLKRVHRVLRVMTEEEVLGV